MKSLLSELNLMFLVTINLFPDVFYFSDSIGVESEDKLP